MAEDRPDTKKHFEQGANESTHDLTVGVSSLDRTLSDVGKPSTSQSGFYRDKKSNQKGTSEKKRGEKSRSKG